MSSTVPSRDNDYSFPPAPAKAVLTREAWDGVMADLSVRLAEVEAQRTELEDLINDLSFNGQARIDEAITPLIEQTKAQLATLQADAEALRDQIDLILAGGIPATDVAESESRVFVTLAQKAALVNALLNIEHMKVDLDQFADRLAAIEAKNTAQDERIAAIEAAKASGVDVTAGTNSTKVTTPKALIDAMAFVQFSASTINLASLINGRITLAANTTFAAATNAKEGQSGILAIAQDATGGRTGSWATFWDFGKAGVPTLSTAANAVDYVSYAIPPGAAKAICTFWQSA